MVRFPSWKQEEEKEDPAKGIKYKTAEYHVGHSIAIEKQENGNLLIHCPQCKKTLAIIKKM